MIISQPSTPAAAAARSAEAKAPATRPPPSALTHRACRQVLNGLAERSTPILEVAELVEALVSRCQQHDVAGSRQRCRGRYRVTERGDDGAGGEAAPRECLVELTGAGSVEHRVPGASHDLVGKRLDRGAGSLATADPDDRPPWKGAQCRNRGFDVGRLAIVDPEHTVLIAHGLKPVRDRVKIAHRSGDRRCADSRG